MTKKTQPRPLSSEELEDYLARISHQPVGIRLHPSI
jgi:hypothetical protein